MNATRARATLSVDRAVWYHVKDIEVDYASIANYYERLPFADKPRLQDCKIHISALGFLGKIGEPLSDQQLGRGPSQPKLRFFERHVLVDGVHLLEAGDAHLLDPLAPSADVLLFLGSSVFASDYSRIALSLGQQLAAYARGKNSYPGRSKEEEKLRAELKEQEEAALKRLGGVIDIASDGIASGIGSALLHSVALVMGGSLGEFGLDVSSEAVSEVVETVTEGGQDRRSRVKTGKNLLDYALAREATLNAPPAEHILEREAVRFDPRSGEGPHSAMMLWSRRQHRDFIDWKHRRRSLGHKSLSHFGR